MGKLLHVNLSFSFFLAVNYSPPLLENNFFLSLYL